jgi:AcrR family transcriptional regulator
MAKSAARRTKRAAVPGQAPSAAEPQPVGKDHVRAVSAVGARAKRSAERRDSILAAALDEFSASGFASTRLDDVARRAGVAKGTIYLHFADKETLFQELIRMELSPVVAALEQVSHADIPLRQVTDRLVEVFVREIFGTRRKDVIRLVLTEGPRFPALAEFYFREVISRVMATIRDMLRRAHQRGELKSDALVRFPQLLPAPGIVAIIWSGLFDRFEPLDVRAMMHAHFDILLGPRSEAP